MTRDDLRAGPEHIALIAPPHTGLSLVALATIGLWRRLLTRRARDD